MLLYWRIIYQPVREGIREGDTPYLIFSGEEYP
jgi:hypothetical protein